LDIAMNSVDGLSRQVLGAGADAVVLEPAELRENVVRELRALVGGRA
jgi:proteasome accessory factor B